MRNGKHGHRTHRRRVFCLGLVREKQTIGDRGRRKPVHRLRGCAVFNDHPGRLPRQIKVARLVSGGCRSVARIFLNTGAGVKRAAPAIGRLALRMGGPCAPSFCSSRSLLVVAPNVAPNQRNTQRVDRKCSNPLSVLAPRAGFEPATQRLTAACSTTELPGIRTVFGKRRRSLPYRPPDRQCARVRPIRELAGGRTSR